MHKKIVNCHMYASDIYLLRALSIVCISTLLKSKGVAKMIEKEYTSARIRADRKMMLDKIAIKIGYATQKPCKWTDVLNYLIENYAKDAEQDMIHQTQGKETKKQSV